MNKTGRYKVVLVSPELIGMFLEEGVEQHFRVDKGLPQDAKFIQMFPDFDRRCVCLIFEHESFEESDLNTLSSELPVVKIEVTRIYDDEMSLRD